MNSKERHEIRYQRRVAARQAKGLPTVKALAVMKMCSPMSTFIRRAKTAAKGLCGRIVHKAI